ncbi:MAG: hypothetical protein EXS36_03910 [Pedosphaera sp.]|nr:hypothetical protein [Pedosphaera sp.]
MWDTQLHSRIGRFRGKLDGLASLAWSSHWLAAGSWNGYLKIWDIETNQEVVSFKAHPTFLFALAFSPDGKTLVTGGGDQKIYFWDIAALNPQAAVTGTLQSNPELRKMATLQGHLHEVWAVPFSPDGQSLVSGGKDGTTQFWSGTPRANEYVLTEVQQALRFSEDGNRLLTLNMD